MRGEITDGWREGVAAFCTRHPLFVAALLTVGSVAGAACWLGLGLAVSVAAGLLGGYLRGWRVGLGWVACGFLAVGAFTWRKASCEADGRALIGTTASGMRGRVLRDAKGSENSWKAPAVLLTGPRAGATVWWEGRGVIPVSGSRVVGSGNFGPLPVMRNPGEFDQEGWLRSQGVAAVFHADWVKGEVTTGGWSALGARIRRDFRVAVTDGLAEDSQAAVVIRAVVIGEQPPDAEELVAEFRNSGTLYAFSVSGLHVAMVGGIGWMVLRLLGVSRRRAVLLLLPLVFGYAWITGNSAPSVRAAWMAVVYLGAFVFRRRPDGLNALGAVLLVTLLWNGRLLFLPGMQLSYGVVAAIAIGAGWTSKLFSRLAKPELYLPLAMMNRWQAAWLWLRRKVAQSLGVSLAAGIGSSPLTAWHFGLVTPVTVLAAVVFVPLIDFMLHAALLSVALHPVYPPAARWVNRVNAGLAKCSVRAAEGFAAIPGGHFQVGQENRPFLLIYDLDRGNGAACFSGGKSGAVLMDCADRYSFRRRVAPSLRRLGIVPDAVVLSHPDGGHLGGGAAVWSLLPIRQVLLPVAKSRSPGFRSWATDAPAAGIKTLQAADFHDLPMPDEARLEILHVPAADSQNAPADDRVAIYRLHWRGWKLLFTSDAGVGTEMAMLEAHQNVAADVIIAGRHRTDESLCDAFLTAVNPQAIIASHSEFPKSEQLKPETVKYWRSRGIKVIHQGESGGVTLRVDGDGNLRLEGFADQSVMVLKPR